MLGERLVRLFRLGRVSYVEAMALQEGLAEEMRVRAKRGDGESIDSLLLLEHDPVYTVGIRSKVGNTN